MLKTDDKVFSKITLNGKPRLSSKTKIAIKKKKIKIRVLATIPKNRQKLRFTVLLCAPTMFLLRRKPPKIHEASRERSISLLG